MISNRLNVVPWAAGLLALLASLAGLAASAQDGLLSEYCPPEWRGDAQLRDVFFVDADTGWAVGTRGVVLRTENGGQDWQQVRVPVSCTFESVFFVDRRRGWIAGGAAVPFTGQTFGAVLTTDDGGRTWHPVRGVALPWLRRVWFSDSQRGYALGDSSPLYPSGLYTTADGGLTWSGPYTDRAGDWIAGAPAAGGWIATDGQRVVRMQAGQARVTELSLSTASDAWRDVRALDARRLVAVGIHGRIALSDDAGQRWHSLPLDWLPIAASSFDFQTIAAAGEHVWIAGQPGSYILRMDLATGQWSAQRTGTSANIRRLFFLDAQRGWAVGSLGTILATTDGGQSWQVQRQAADRVAMLVVADSPHSIPWELVARYAADEGWLCSVLVLTSPDGVENGSGDTEAFHRRGARIEQAVLRVGASTAALLQPGPVPADAVSGHFTPNRGDLHPGQLQGGQPLRGGSESDGPLVAEDLQDGALVVELVRQLRMLRPAVVFTCEESNSRPGLPPLAGRAQRAIQLAAEPSFHFEHVTGAALQPWRATVHLMAAENERDVVVVGEQFATRIGETLVDFCALSRALVGSADLPPRQLGFALVSGLGAPRSGDSLGDLAARDPEAPRRDQHSAPLGRMSLVRQATRKQEQLTQLAQWQSHRDNHDQVWLQGIERLVAELEPHTAAVWLFQLGNRYLQEGRPDMTAATLTQLVRRYGNHALAPAATHWLARYWAGEAWQTLKLKPEDRPDETLDGHDPNVRLAVGGGPGASADREPPAASAPRRVIVAGQTKMIWEPLLDNAPGEADPRRDDTGVEQASHARLSNPSQQDRWEDALAAYRHFQQQFPHLAGDPALRYLNATLVRKSRGADAADSLYRAIARDSHAGPWARAAALEVAHFGGTAAKSPRAVSLVVTGDWPLLDGRLDDPLWQHALETGAVLQLDPPRPNRPETDASGPSRGVSVEGGAMPTARVLLACDGEFLYIAVQCIEPADESSPVTAATETRRRNPDLSREDRIELRIDTQRDYGSFFRLVMDHRGRVAEFCTGIDSWNPQWYVAHGRDPRGWTIEAAIALSELGVERLTPGTVWAMSAQRLKGSHAVGAWGGPAAAAPPWTSPACVSYLLNQSPDRYGWVRFVLDELKPPGPDDN